MLELFKLLGTIAVDNKEAVNALNETSGTAEKTHSRLGGAFNKIGGAAKVCGKAVAAGLAAGATAMAGLTVKAMNAAGELEQNMGGSEAVFKEHAERMQETANKAFSQMGLSTSDFLATANKMGALFQGAGFEISESADMSSAAMQRAADVASIMGIDVNAAMEAVAGMAKGNFTMMDNLGVAINDTTLEIYAQEKGLGELETTQDKVNAAYLMFMERSEYAAENYAKENETLAGSLTTMKAAISNFLSGTGTVDDLANAFKNAGIVIMKNLKALLPKLVQGLRELVEVLIPEIPPLIQDLFPALLEGSIILIGGIVRMLPELLRTLFSTVKTLFAENFGSAYKQVENGFQNLWMVLQTIWGSVGKPIFDMIASVVESVRGIFEAKMPEIQGFVSSCFTDIQNFWENNLKPCLDAIGGFITNTLAPIVQTFFNTYFTGYVETAFNYIKTLWEGTLKPIFVGITDFLTGVFTGDWGKAWEGILSILKGIINGVITGVEAMINVCINAINALISAINDLAIVEAIADVFGIDGIPTIPTVSFPRLEKGGILEKGQVGLLEGNGAEAVVPLERNRAWISAVASDMQSAFGGVSYAAGSGMQDVLLSIERMIDVQTDAIVKAVGNLQESGTIRVEDPNKLFKLIRKEQRNFRLATGEGGI